MFHGQYANPMDLLNRLVWEVDSFVDSLFGLPMYRDMERIMAVTVVAWKDSEMVQGQRWIGSGAG
jgi:hypothetical protein